MTDKKEEPQVEYILVRTTDKALMRAVKQVIVASADPAAGFIPAAEGRRLLWGEVEGRPPLFELLDETYGLHMAQAKARSFK